MVNKSSCGCGGGGIGTLLLFGALGYFVYGGLNGVFGNDYSLLTFWISSLVFHNSIHWNWDTIFGVCKCNFTTGFFFYRDRTYLVNNAHIDLDDDLWTHRLWRINLLYLSMFVQQILPMRVNV